MTYVSDPEGVPEDWEEPILADGQQQARRKCKAIAEDCTEQGRSEIEWPASLGQDRLLELLPLPFRSGCDFPREG